MKDSQYIFGSLVPAKQFDVGGGYPGPQCFKFITMKYKGKTAKAQIMDRVIRHWRFELLLILQCQCPGCPYGGLDLSEGLFSHFSDLSEGVLSGSWSFTSTGPEDEDDNSTIHERPTTTYHVIKATKTQTPPPSSNPHHEITMTDSSSFTIHASSSSASSSTSVTGYSIPSSSAVPIPTGIFNEQGENIDSINAVLVGLAELLFAGLYAD